eukprot:3047233-Pyramimonas_sp.AAC.2
MLIPLHLVLPQCCSRCNGGDRPRFTPLALRLEARPRSPVGMAARRKKRRLEPPEGGEGGDGSDDGAPAPPVPVSQYSCLGTHVLRAWSWG